MSAPASTRASMEAILGDVRKELLDFGLRNPLLNYRLLKSKGLEVIDGNSVAAYEALVQDRSRFLFESTEDNTPNGGQNELIDFDADHGDGDSQSSPLAGRVDRRVRLTSALTEKQLQTRLLATYYVACHVLRGTHIHGRARG